MAKSGRSSRQGCGGWQLSSNLRLNDGRPINFRSSSVCNIPGQLAAECIPGVLPGADPYVVKPGNWDPGAGPLFKASAFEPPSSFNYYLGQGARISNYRAFGYQNQDIALAKTIKLTEKLGMQLRGEFFNVWNWHTFAMMENIGYGLPINNDVSSPTFGDWNGNESPPRNIQVAIKFMF